MDGSNGESIPTGLEGVVVAATTIGDVRGAEGFFHYRGYSATDLARHRSFSDVWALLVDGELPDAAGSAAFRADVARRRELPAGVADLVAEVAPRQSPLETLRTAVSALGAEAGWGPTLDLGPDELREQTLDLVATVPTIVAAAHRCSTGRAPVAPRPDLGHAANLLWMLRGEEPSPRLARALEQYLVLTVDHGFNASTFAARVITSTGSDLASAVVGALGALAGPLHGGAPSRALEMLDTIDSADRARDWVAGTVAAGGRVMGFGHRVYSTEDPRSALLAEVAAGIGGDRARRAGEIEQVVLDTLEELKPGRDLCTNVEFYAGVVMDACGIPAEVFTPTFAAARTVGWTAHVREQAAANRLIRPSATYVGPAPRAVPALELSRAG